MQLCTGSKVDVPTDYRAMDGNPCSVSCPRDAGKAKRSETEEQRRLEPWMNQQLHKRFNVAHLIGT
jgi:hypothetical protein